MRNLIILFFLLPVTVFSQSITDYNGYDWINWNYSTKSVFITGFALSSYATCQMMINANLIDDIEYQKMHEFSLAGLTVEQLIFEVDEFYENSNAYDWPLYAVVYLRKAWKIMELPPWEVMKSKGIGWK